MEQSSNFEIKTAEEKNVGIIFIFIKELAEYERLSHTVVATENSLRQWLFGEHPMAEVILAYTHGKPVGFALFFHNFSTFEGKPGIYLEDLYVRPEYRGKGLGQQLLRYLAKLAKERDCGRFEWTVLDWNESAIQFYRKLGADLLKDWRICRVTGDSLEKLAVDSYQ